MAIERRKFEIESHLQKISAEDIGKKMVVQTSLVQRSSAEERRYGDVKEQFMRYQVAYKNLLHSSPPDYRKRVFHI
ncbi:hypothetical protein PCANC_00169 [Puccinia coronata f. sp. avenae]|uniref:Uncharacterized protein n=1 Tax=Puccinia coronata f. sp. avenae TaxID=200324 RepID=A0A2N5SZY4_9BASI|nr:hypothetical protein PCASD_19060 [Puccinia coronata f. sp. avenae]PLW18799.1 hypothetical protein PCANC_06614 [Puccinia coronata f. sp. avenae]PLW46359.1 hypothetical protein PCASD_05501 [Puccinia coronata f. sp. avenae]PLW58553.1 hypothetical protein PCANC_00169 [Puccinia coronata f. sp. avenae]